MRAWTNLKEILNEGLTLSRDTLIQKVRIPNYDISIKTIYHYLDILEESRYINLNYEYLSKYKLIRIAHYKLIKKIPKKLTINDAKKMKHMPWIEWFKYPE